MKIIASLKPIETDADVDALIAETAAIVQASASARKAITIESDAREQAVQRMRDLITIATGFAIPRDSAAAVAADAFHRGITADQFRAELDEQARAAHEAIWAKRNGRAGS
jgi:hypothetical protein